MGVLLGGFWFDSYNGISLLKVLYFIIDLSSFMIGIDIIDI